MEITILTILAIVSACLQVLAEYRGPKVQIYICKPLTMVFILGIALLGGDSEPLYKYLIITGLLFSLAGDIFLMLPDDRFISGLVSFLIAHLFYIWAFGLNLSGYIWWPLMLLGVYGIMIYFFLAPSLSKLKIPVIVYISAILCMVWLAWEGYVQHSSEKASLAIIGAGLFAVSDSALAINRFRKPFAQSRAVIMFTYFAAQWCIASSI